MERLIKEHEYPRWQRGEDIGPRLARDRSHEDNWEGDDGEEQQGEGEDDDVGVHGVVLPVV